jgi:acetyltransferase-like isoleucine patch superfamily enzyme
MLLKGDDVRIYGRVSFGERVIIEDNVVLGHPSAEELRMALENMESFASLEDLYNSAGRHITKIGYHAMIRSGTVIYSGTSIGDDFDCGHNVLIRENVTIGNKVYIKPFTEVMKNVRIGNNCRLAGTISDNTIIGDNVSSFGILTHRYERQYTPDMSLRAGPIIEDGCIIGRGAVIIGGCVVHAGAIIGANTFVNFDVPEKARVVGLKGRILEVPDPDP